MHRAYGARKARLFHGLPERVVELGPGAGANLRYYTPGTRVLAFEPNTLMHPRLTRHARERGIHLDLHARPAESLPLEEASVGAVVCTLVLCSVSDPWAVVREVHRVLEPGGRFVFIEHVAALEGSLLSRAQRWLKRPWRWAFEGCSLDRNTQTVIEAAGFRELEIERFNLGRGVAPFSPHIAGVGVR